MDVNERMAVNAAIETILKDPNNIEAAQTIIEFGQGLKTADRVRYEVHTRRSGKGNLTGHTEHGNANIQSDSEEKHDLERGVNYERIGYYKLAKESAGVIFFQDFWKADITTMSFTDRPAGYYLFYDPNTLEYQDLAQQSLEITRSWWIFYWGVIKFTSLKTGEIRTGGKFRIIYFTMRK